MTAPNAPKTLILLAMPETVRMQYWNGLRAAFPDLQIDCVEHHSKVDPYIGDAEVLITFGAMMDSHVLPKAKRLRWVQALGSGVDKLADQPALGADVVLTNLHGFHGPPVAEAAVAAMLALGRGLKRSLRSQAEGKWDRFPAHLLNGKTAGIYGVGVIATTLAPILKAFGMTVIGISSAPRELAGFDRMVPRADLVRAAAELDFLVLLAPLDELTRNSMNAGVFAAMKPTAYLVNVARGGVVDEAALLEALEAKRIAGAALDVFATEPLPADHPFWSMPNVIITPHLGGFYDGYVEQALPGVIENMRRFRAGNLAGMLNIVDRKRA